MGLDAASGLQSVAVGHTDVHQHQIRMQQLRLLDRLQAIPGLPDNLEIGLTIEQPGQSLAEQQMIVHQQNTQRLHHLLYYTHNGNLTQRTIIPLTYNTTPLKKATNSTQRRRDAKKNKCQVNISQSNVPMPSNTEVPLKNLCTSASLR